MVDAGDRTPHGHPAAGREPAPKTVPLAALRAGEPHWFNVPNLLTFLRAALVPLIFWLLAVDGAGDTARWWAFGIFVFAAATDSIDGWVARRWHGVTTWGQLADQALITVGTVDEDVVSAAFDVIGKGGTVVVTGLANPEKLTVHVSGAVLTLFEKTIKGTLFGSANPQYDIVKLLRLYDAGKLKLDELVTKKYTLDQVNEGYQDLRDGKNIRGVIVHAS
jgi:Zn-dependent alcohol dehydrogenase